MLRPWLPVEGELPTPTASATPDPLEISFQQGLELAASDPLAALPFLQDVSFSSNPSAPAARKLAQAVQAARLAGDPAYTLTASGQALAAMGEWELARKAFLRAVELAPDYVEAWAYLGEAQQQSGEDGLPALKRALELNPDSLSAQLFSALYWQRQGNYRQAGLHFYVAALIAPADPYIQIQWGQNSVLAGDTSGARNHFQRAAELSPDNPEVQKHLVRYSLDTELYVEEIALPAAQKLLKDDPSDPEILTLLGRAHSFLEESEAARFYLLRAVTLDPDYAPAQLYYGLFLLSSGERQEALLHLTKVLELVPGSHEADLASQAIVQSSH